LFRSASKNVGDYALSQRWISAAQHSARSFHWSQVYCTGFQLLSNPKTFVQTALMTRFASSKDRQCAVETCLRGAANTSDVTKVTVETAIATLRNHHVRAAKTKSPAAFDPTTGYLYMDVCAHAGPGPNRISHTTGSMISHLPPASAAGAVATHWVTGTSTPCVSVYKPVFVPSALNFGPEPHPSMYDRSRFDVL
jgi:hypothetical protein